MPLDAESRFWVHLISPGLASENPVDLCFTGSPTEDIRLLRPGETFPHLLFQTRYRVNCFVDLCPDKYFDAFACDREGEPASSCPCEAVDERLYTTHSPAPLAREK